MANLGYVRVSSLSQNTGRQFALFEEREIHLDKTYTEKVSGKNIKDRPQLQEMLKCTTGNVHCDYLDSAVIVIISNMVFNEQLVPSLLAKYNEAVAKADSETTQSITKISKKISGVDNAIANIINAIERSGSTALLSRLKDLESQKAELTQKKEQLKESAAVQSIDADLMRTLIARAKALLSDKDNSATQRLVDMFIEGVEIFSDRIDIKINAAPFISKSNYTRFIESIPRHPLK